MSFCPICDDFIVDKDVLALGCGHILCSDCLSILLKTGRQKECPLCKQKIYESEIRKIFLNESINECTPCLLNIEIIIIIDMDENEKNIIETTVTEFFIYHELDCNKSSQ